MLSLSNKNPGAETWRTKTKNKNMLNAKVTDIEPNKAAIYNYFVNKMCPLDSKHCLMDTSTW